MVVLHDEIDLPFGEVRVRLGGGVAGHNGLKSLRAGARRAPTSGASASGSGGPSRPTRRSSRAYVLSRFAEPDEEVRELIGRAADEAERLLERIEAEGAQESGEGSGK